MNRKLVMGCLAGVSAIAVTAGGVTYAAFSDFADVTGNSVGAGILKLDLGPDGAGSTALNFSGMQPGSTVVQPIWVSNDSNSTPAGNLTVSFTGIDDTAASCKGNLAKYLGEQESGTLGDCSVADSGKPSQGNLSRVLSFGGSYYPGVTDAASCATITAATEPADAVDFLSASRGNVRSASQHEIEDSSGAAAVLAPDAGACVGITATWTPGSAPYSADHPSDDAAQGDSLSFDVRFDLTQVLS